MKQVIAYWTEARPEKHRLAFELVQNGDAIARVWQSESGLWNHWTKFGGSLLSQGTSGTARRAASRARGSLANRYGTIERQLVCRNLTLIAEATR